jgi:Na+/H+ antiporter NhaC
MGVAFLSRQVMLALAAGVFAGAFVTTHLNIFAAALRTFDTYIVKAIGNPHHAAILAFLVGVAGMIGVLSRNGGLKAVVEKLPVLVKTRGGALVETWAMGLILFMDPYANSMAVGSTVRSMSDRMKVSREKLAFLLNGTGVTVASIAFLSTFIGAGLVLMEKVMASTPPSTLGGFAEMRAYEVFLGSIPFAFYSILMLIFVLATSATQRDFGPMLWAERRAVSTGAVVRAGSQPLVEAEAPQVKGDRPPRLINGLGPITGLILFAGLGLILSGMLAPSRPSGAGLARTLGSADSMSALIWAAAGGTVVAVVLSVLTRALTLAESVDAWIRGARSMALALVVLVMAWAMAAACQDAGTGRFLANLIAAFNPTFLPGMVFMVAGLIALSTGSMFGGLAIAIPVLLPLVFRFTSEGGVDASMANHIRFACVGAIFSGTLWGNHISPFSDTSVIASSAAGCDHLDHYKSLFPYSAFIGLLALAVGFLPAGFGMIPWLTYGVGAGAIGVVLYIMCERPRASAGPESRPPPVTEAS